MPFYAVASGPFLECISADSFDEAGELAIAKLVVDATKFGESFHPHRELGRFTVIKMHGESLGEERWFPTDVLWKAIVRKGYAVPAKTKCHPKD